MKKNILLLLCLVGLLSCTDRKDLYNPDLKTDPKDNPLEVEVPNNVDYSMITAVTVRVDVDDEYLGKYYYVVEVYDNDPLFSETPNLKAAGVAKQGEPFVKNIDIATAQKYLFIKRTDPRGRSVVGCLEVTEGATSLSYDFNPSTSKKSVTPRAATRATVEMPTYTEVPAGAIEVEGWQDNQYWFDAGKDYKITKDYRGGIYHSGRGDCRLFISGTWTVPSHSDAHWQGKIEKGLEVIILPGGRIISETKLSFIGTSSLIIMKDAILDCSLLEFTNTGITYNLGQMNLGDVTLQSNSTLYNNCGIKVTNHFNADASHVVINLSNGSIEAEKITFNNVIVNMSDGSMVKASSEIDNMSNTKYYAIGNGSSLVDAPNIKCSSSVLYDGKLTVHALTHTAGDQYWSPYRLSNGAILTKDDVVSIETCGGGSATPDPGHDPTDPTFPLEVTISDTYIYAMEDQWPSYGDYDMNDVVVRVKKNIKAQVGAGSGSDYASGLELDVELLAVGADKQIGAGIQLDGTSISTVNTIMHDKKGDGIITGFSIVNDGNNHSEQGNATDDIILPLFNSASKLLGGNYVNVGKGSSMTSYPNMKINVSFANNKVPVNDLNHAKINFFITTDGVGQDRTEIHLLGYTATRKANKSLFGEGDDNGKGTYVSRENLSWGLLLPIATWRWPNEGVNIKTIYPSFESWITSGGKNDKDWYQQRRD